MDVDDTTLGGAHVARSILFISAWKSTKGDGKATSSTASHRF